MSAASPVVLNRRLFLGSTALFAVALAFLPAWDGLHHVPRFVLAAIAAGAGVAAFLRIEGWWRWPVLVGGVLFIVLYAGISGGSVLLERSREVDQLRPCGVGVAEPCLALGDTREDHRKWHPGGDLEDGFRQVLLRYPGDEPRLILAPMIALFLIAAAGVLLAKAAPPRE